MTTEDAVLAARLVLAPRARVAPATDEADDDDDPRNSPNDADSAPEQAADGDFTSDPSTEVPSLDEIMLAAVRTALPSDLLEWMGDGAMDRRPATRRQGRGGTQASYLRGRPAGTRMGALRSGSRLALVATLRAAAPWQAVRRAAAPDEPSSRILVRRDDFRIKKFVQRRESTIVFCVDASGSSAFHRLAEAKGAVELLLGEAYARAPMRPWSCFAACMPRSCCRRHDPWRARNPSSSTYRAAAERPWRRASTRRRDSPQRTRKGSCAVDRPIDRWTRQHSARRTTAMRAAYERWTRRGNWRRKASLRTHRHISASAREAAKLAVAMGARYVTLPYLDSSSVREWYSLKCTRAQTCAVAMKSAPEWDVEGRDWPNRVSQPFRQGSRHSWHVQIMGRGAVLLLIHGTGAATHSWRALAPMLSDSFRSLPRSARPRLHR